MTFLKSLLAGSSGSNWINETKAGDKAKEWTAELAKHLFIPADLERMDKSDDSEADDERTPKRGKFCGMLNLDYSK